MLRVEALATPRSPAAAFLGDASVFRLQETQQTLRRSSSGKGQRSCAVLSDVVHGEVMGLCQDPTEAAAIALLTEELTGRQRTAITAVCTGMHRPYLNAVGPVLKDAETVFDKFHVLQHASAASDDVRR